MNTTENNKLIAEFMGLQKSLMTTRNPHEGLVSDGTAWVLYGVDKYKHLFRDEELEYHTSWDWLMPVVEKIEDEGVEIVTTNGECVISHNDYYKLTTGKSRFGVTYEAVVEFIKWYNKNKKE